MGTEEADTINIPDRGVQLDEEVEVDDVMDQLLFIIKDELPKEVVLHLYREVENIRGLKSVTDMKVFLIIEFESKVDAKAAKSRGFEYTHNGQKQTVRYKTASIISLYMANECNGRGTGI